ncbi:hypothetical protein [Lusitaniella coriacea]|uniref:hypothetical protein n=1 Tax=Lusitaniella coriacea TaxID=1983105 RepID=UPI003CF38FD4
MAHLPFQFPKNLKQLALCFPLAIGLCAIAPEPASACSPNPGSRPAPLEERLSTTPYVFEGTITQVNGDILTIRVNRYFKGEGSQLVRLSGFNQHSCQDIINETGGRYLFFAEPGEKGNLNAAYDGAFGSVRSWSEEIETELGKLGGGKESNSSDEPLPQSVANAVKFAAARETGRSTSTIQILQAEPFTWSDNCLGLPFADRGCRRTTVEGWKVTVRAGNRRLIYRTNERGNIVYRDRENSPPPSEENSEEDLKTLPRSVANAVKIAAARETRGFPREIEILSAEPHTWSNGCLGLTLPNRACTQALVEGWRVTVRAGNRQLVYRTDSRGFAVYLDDTNRSHSLPKSIVDAVKRETAQRFRISPHKLQVTNATQQTWSNGCLGVNIRDRACTEALVEGWLVELQVIQPSEDGNNILIRPAQVERFIYRTDASGDTIYLDNGVDVLPANIREAVLANAIRKTQLPRGQLRITDAFPQVWDGCFGIYEDPRQICTKIAIFGWQVAIEGTDNSLLVYHTNQDNSEVRLNVNASRVNSEDTAAFPTSVKQSVLNAAARRTGLSPTRLRVTAVQRRTWDGCLGIYRDRAACPEIGIFGWKVTVESGENRLIYHTDANGSDVRLNVPESRLANNRDRDEDRTSLPKGAIFRAISSGGFVGGMTEITLWSNGKVTRQSSFIGNGQPQTHRVSRQQVRNFQRTLRQQNFTRYDGLNFPPPPGSADIIGMTLMSQRGITNVADYDRDKLPQPLQIILESWGELLGSLEE